MSKINITEQNLLAVVKQFYSFLDQNDYVKAEGLLDEYVKQTKDL